MKGRKNRRKPGYVGGGTRGNLGAVDQFGLPPLPTGYGCDVVWEENLRIGSRMGIRAFAADKVGQQAGLEAPPRRKYLTVFCCQRSLPFPECRLGLGRGLPQGCPTQRQLQRSHLHRAYEGATHQ